jgi:hypothetical protein
MAGQSPERAVHVKQVDVDLADTAMHRRPIESPL